MSAGIYHSLQVSIVAISLLAAVGQARAATYYVDYSAGSDSANGTSTSTPWKHCPGDYAATGNCPGVNSGSYNTNPSTTNKLNPGDKVCFKGGVSYVAVYTVVHDIYSNLHTNAGIVVNYPGVTYDGNTSGNWGTGMAQMTSDWVSNVFFFTANSMSNISFTGLTFTNIGGYAINDPIWQTTNSNDGTSVDGRGIYLYECNNILVSGCNFSRIGQWSNAIPIDSTYAGVNGMGIQAFGNNGLVITNCDFTCMGKGIEILSLANHPATNWIITACSIHNYINWGIDIIPGDTYGDLICSGLITNCWIHDYNEFDQGRWKGYGDPPHDDGIFIRTANLASSWTNIVIANNKFSSDNPSGGGTACIYLSQGTSATIINNLFLNDGHADGMVYLAYFKTGIVNYQYLKCYNNTFVGLGAAINIDNGNSNPDLVDVRNNVFYNLTTERNRTEISVNFTNTIAFIWDYNLYYSNYTPLTNYFIMYPWWATFSQWQSQSGGLDSHSWLTSSGLTSLSGAASTWNTQLLTNSLAIGKGVNLSSAFTKDYAGNARPAMGNWTIGAYAATVSSPAPLVSLVASPTSVTNGQSTKLTWSSANATSVTLNGFGPVPLNGSTNVMPGKVTTYTVTATGTNGSSTAQVSFLLPPTALHIQ